MYRDVQVVVPAHPSAIAPCISLPPASLQSCAPRHSDIQSSVARGQEKVRPGTGREAGLDHAQSDLRRGRRSHGPVHDLTGGEFRKQFARMHFTL